MNDKFADNIGVYSISNRCVFLLLIDIRINPGLELDSDPDPAGSCKENSVSGHN